MRYEPNLAEKSAPRLKSYRVTAQGTEGNITHTTITSYGYGTLPLKAVPTNQGLYLFYATYSFHTIFLVNFILPSTNLLHKPPNYIFATPSSQLIFATPFHDSIS